MSKKSRRRNRKILGALAALGTGLALANRGKGTEMSNVSVDSGRGSGLRPTVDDVEFKETIVSAPIKKPIVNLGKMQGSGPESGLIGQRKRANYVQRIKDSQNADMMRAIRSNNAYRGDMMTAPRIDEFKTSEYDYFSKGGRVKKRNGAAKRGFGRAFKGGK